MRQKGKCRKAHSRQENGEGTRYNGVPPGDAFSARILAVLRFFFSLQKSRKNLPFPLENARGLCYNEDRNLCWRHFYA